MTYSELISLFHIKHPKLHIIDYRPYYDIKMSLIIWLSNEIELTVQYNPILDCFILVNNPKSYDELMSR